jgi:guanylate kinase
MRDRLKCSVRACAKFDPLNHRRPVTQSIHLRPRQHDTHRALQRERGEHRQHHLELRAQTRAEPTAHERRHDTYILGLHAEHAAEIALNVLHALRLVVDR